MNVFRIYLSLLCFALAVAAGCKKDKATPPPTAPIVTTAALSNITPSGATAGGSIVSDGGDTVTASGIVWSQTNAMPTLADSVVAGTTATGTFTVDIAGLEFDKSYYVRAFATNSVGTGYGEVVTLSTMNDTNKVRFTYNGEEVTYGIIVSAASGRKWLDRNLGAKRIATARDDYQAYGDLFQWGRPADGHQLINWTSSSGTPLNGTTTTLSTSDIPEHSNFIIPPGDVDPIDWRSDNNRNRWATSPQGPCPNGWHVPTISEWQAEASSGGITKSSDAYSLLKLTVAGKRQINSSGGVDFKQVGNGGRYWSNSDKFIDSGPFSIGRAAEIGTDFFQQASVPKGDAMSVRCIKD